MFEPAASEFVAAGKGHIVAAVGAVSGSIPYTAFSASKSYLEKNKDVVKDFLSAIMKGYKYLSENPPEVVAKSLAKSFSGTSEASIAASISSYLAIDAWRTDPTLEKSSFERMQDIMQNSGDLSSRADYSLAVDNSIVESLMNLS
jgi:NitT/TauT family transport system substrate-binding protein